MQLITEKQYIGIIDEISESDFDLEDKLALLSFFEDNYQIKFKKYGGSRTNKKETNIFCPRANLV